MSKTDRNDGDRTSRQLAVFAWRITLVTGIASQHIQLCKRRAWGVSREMREASNRRPRLLRRKTGRNNVDQECPGSSEHLPEVPSNQSAIANQYSQRRQRMTWHDSSETRGRREQHATALVDGQDRRINGDRKRSNSSERSPGAPTTAVTCCRPVDTHLPTIACRVSRETRSARTVRAHFG